MEKPCLATSGRVFLLNKQTNKQSVKCKASCLSASFSFVLTSLRKLLNAVYTSQKGLVC